ncbi:hypothetical protein Bp8pS_218 [Bacillus phage vB_BpuM-BpSp]|nr:hypothetical protein Bp8pS_218 [Bacillus phage vB_BpuM-BpSp]
MSTFFKTLTEETEVTMVENDLEKLLQEASVVRMDKQALRRKMITRASLLAAQANNDPLFTKYQKHSRLRRHFRLEIKKKYNSKAKSLANDYMRKQKAK